MKKEINRPLLRAAYLVPFLVGSMPFGVAAAVPARPYITELFVNKSGVLGLAWSPVAGAATMRLQVSSLPLNGCPLDTSPRTTCAVNKVVPLTGPLNPAANTGVAVSGFNGGNIFARLVAVDATGKLMTDGAWMQVPHYLGLTSGGKAWPLPSVVPGQPVTVSASVTNGTLATELWAFDIQGNSSTKTKSGLNFTVTPMTAGAQQTWVLKSKTTTGLVIDQGFVNVTLPPLVTKEQLGSMLLGDKYNGVTQNYLAFFSGYGYHPGIDYRAQSRLPVYSPVSGYVMYADPSGVGYGQVGVKIDGGSTGFIFMHLSSTYVKVGQHISKGCVIGVSGSSVPKGVKSVDPHLHVETREGAYQGANYFGSPSNYGVNRDPASIVRGFSAPTKQPC